jgi:hypothetical protein
MAEKITTKQLSADEQKQLISTYEQRYHKAERGMDVKHDKWQTLDMFDRGEQWVGQSIPPWIPKPVTNFVRFIRTLKRANLASSIPKSTFYPEYEEDKQTVEQLQKAYNFIWDRQKINRVIRKGIDRSLLQGTAIAYVYVDDLAINGRYFGKDDKRNNLFQGDICVRIFPNTNFFPDPEAYRLEDCKYVETTEITSLRTVKGNKKFREYAGDNLKKLKYSMIGQSQSETGEIYDRDNKIMDGNQPIQGDEMVTVHTHWERYVNDKGAWQLDVTYYIRGTDFLLYRLEDVKPNEYPFAVLYDEEEEQDFWGTSTAMDILENQKIINKLQQTASILGVLHQNPQKVVLRESGINPQELAQTGTLPGKTWASNIPNPIEIVEPMPIPKELFELDDRMKENIRDMVGVNEAYTGQSVGSLTTSTGVDSLIERATIRDKDKMIQIDDFVERISHLIVLHILYKWQDKRPITNIQPNGEPDFATYSPVDKLTADNLMFRVRSDVYAKAPVTQATKRQQADKLMQMQGQFQFNPPIITPEEWINFQDFDDKEAILKRMEADRTKMESQDVNNMAQMMMHVADEMQKMRSQGLPESEVMQTAQQLAVQILQDKQKQDMQNGRPRDAQAEMQQPKGVTGQVQAANMANGA